ncbi:MAG: hypothetical protein H2069_01950 [Legionella sp.]|nr:hypothetical protein [Legionella sp.]
MPKQYISNITPDQYIKATDSLENRVQKAKDYISYTFPKITFNPLEQELGTLTRLELEELINDENKGIKYFLACLSYTMMINRTSIYSYYRDGIEGIVFNSNYKQISDLCTKNKCKVPELKFLPMKLDVIPLDQRPHLINARALKERVEQEPNTLKEEIEYALQQGLPFNQLSTKFKVDPGVFSKIMHNADMSRSKFSHVLLDKRFSLEDISATEPDIQKKVQGPELNYETYVGYKNYTANKQLFFKRKILEGIVQRYEKTFENDSPITNNSDIR